VRLATEAAGLGVWVWEPESDRLTWENERLFEIFGLTGAARGDRQPGGLDERLTELAHPDDAQACRAALSRTAQSGERLRFEGRFFRRNDRSLRWIELTGILQPAHDGTPARVLGTAVDVTDRRHAEDELRRSEERYRALLESLDEGFCVIQMLYGADGRPTDYRFLQVNPAFEKHTGIVAAVGRTMREIAPDHEDHWFEIYGRVAATGEAVRFENQAQALGRWFDVYATCTERGTGKVALLFTDVTERRRSEESLRRLAAELAESDRRKTEFLATLAHELGNPLAPISNGLQLLRIADGDADAKERARNMMERQLRHLVRLVDDLLDIARISSGKVELKKDRASLDTILGSAVESSMPVLNAAGHHLDMRIAEPGLQLVADSTRLAQVVSNLLNNAAKYTPDGGRIELAARREGDEVVISVSDTGIGIAPETLQQVFEMFTQVGRHRERSQGGLGIGLALVRRLVELHGGSVSAHSPGVGQGSTFTVRLPIGTSATTAPPPAPAGPAAAESAPVFRVLVVDDNVDAAESLAALLQLDGHETRVAHDGDTAIAQAADFRPEIVFLDIGMPGKDGYEVARELRRDPRNRDTMLVALTGWGAQDDRARSRSAGFDHHLTKPAELPAVEALLAKMAERRQETSAV
jgi:PAS domain S-box-containing protein